MFIKFNSKKEGKSFLPNYQVSPLFLFVKEYYFETGKSNKLIHFHFNFPKSRQKTNHPNFFLKRATVLSLGCVGNETGDSQSSGTSSSLTGFPSFRRMERQPARKTFVL
jgi:hypothetical protein